MATLNSKNLTLNDVHHLLKLQEQLNNDSFTTWLSLEPITEFEKQEIGQIRNDFRHYIFAGKVYEGLVKALTTFPLLRLAGFYRYPIQISVEEDIADISIIDKDTIITGRFDILAVNKATSTTTDRDCVSKSKVKSQKSKPENRDAIGCKPLNLFMEKKRKFMARTQERDIKASLLQAPNFSYGDSYF